MPSKSHLLRVQDEPSDVQWTIEWDNHFVTLKDPDRQMAFCIARKLFLQLLDLRSLKSRGTLDVTMPHGPMTFLVPRSAEEDFKALVQVRPKIIKSRDRKTAAGQLIRHGLALLLAGGLPFAGYCWWAAVAEDPPAGSTLASLLFWFGWLIRIVLLVLMAAAVGGLMLLYEGLKQWALSFRSPQANAAAARKPQRSRWFEHAPNPELVANQWFRYILPEARMTDSQRRKLGLYELDRSGFWRKHVELDGEEVEFLLIGTGDAPPEAESLAQMERWAAEWPLHRPQVFDFIRRSAAVGQVEIEMAEVERLRLKMIETGRAGLVEGSLLYFSGPAGRMCDWSLLCDRQTPKRIVVGDLDDEQEMELIDQP